MWVSRPGNAGPTPKRSPRGDGRVQQRPQEHLQARGAFRPPLEALLVHVAALADLELHGVDAEFGPAVVAGDVPAPEPAVGPPAPVALPRPPPAPPPPRVGRTPHA